MILASHQPYFLPYLAYWQLIHAADIFLIGDDFAFMKSGWIPRNRILVQGQPQFLRVEVRAKSSFKRICDTSLAPRNNGDKLRTVEMAYHKAPYFNEVYPIIERMLLNGEPNLALFLEASIREICTWLGVTTPIGRTSDLEGNSLLRREDRIYDMCRRMGADCYVNAIGGTSLYHKTEFDRQGIRLQFLRCRHTPYQQFGGPFVPRLSILDAMMFNDREQLHAMLDDYDLVDG